MRRGGGRATAKPPPAVASAGLGALPGLAQPRGLAGSPGLTRGVQERPDLDLLGVKDTEGDDGEELSN